LRSTDASPASVEHAILGTVRDAVDGTPLLRVSVVLAMTSETSVSTAPDGAFRLQVPSSICTGAALTVTATSDGYQTAVRRAVVGQSLDVALQRAGADSSKRTLVLVVRDQQGIPITQFAALVQANVPDGNGPPIIHAAEHEASDGVVAIAVPAEQVIVNVWANNKLPYSSGPVYVGESPSPPVHHVVNLGNGATVFGTIINRRPDVIDHANVAIFPIDYGFASTLSLAELTPITVKRTLRTKRQRVSFDGDRSASFTLEGVPAGSLELAVVDETGTPIIPPVPVPASGNGTLGPFELVLDGNVVRIIALLDGRAVPLCLSIQPGESTGLDATQRLAPWRVAAHAVDGVAVLYPVRPGAYTVTCEWSSKATIPPLFADRGGAVWSVLTQLVAAICNLAMPDTVFVSGEDLSVVGDIGAGCKSYEAWKRMGGTAEPSLGPARSERLRSVEQLMGYLERMVHAVLTEGGQLPESKPTKIDLAVKNRDAAKLLLMALGEEDPW
jgi:hypothetical protein